MPVSNKLASTLVLNDMPAAEFTAWYDRQPYFNLCQLQSGYGYSSAAGLLSGMKRDKYTVNVDDCGNIYPVFTPEELARKEAAVINL